MKVEVKENKKPKNPEFPCIMQSKFGVIVLVTSCTKFGHMSGTVIGITKSTTGKYEIGEYANTWVSGVFEPYKGTVTLSNE